MSVHSVTLNESGRTLSAEEVARANADTVVLSGNPLRISDNPKDIAARDKVPLQLIPPGAELIRAQVHASGNSKYGPFNWREKPIGLMTYIGAIMRHVNAMRRGEDIDPESGLPHAAHIGATADIIIDAHEHGKLIDDRPGA